MRTNALVVRGQVECREVTDGPSTTIDLTHGKTLLDTAAVRSDGSFELVASTLDGEDMRDLSVWLPHRVECRDINLAVPSGCQVERPSTPEPRWLAYGSSITQGIHASSPARAWPAVAALDTGYDLHNLGLASEALLDPHVAMQMRDTPAALITICAGINAHTTNAMSLRTMTSALLGFLMLVREGHDDTPIVVISPIASPSREQTPAGPRVLPGLVRRSIVRGQKLPPLASLASTFGPTLQQIRERVHRVAEHLRTAGDANLHLIDGRDLLGADDAGLLIDGLHPGDEGARVIAERFVERAEHVLN